MQEVIAAYYLIDCFTAYLTNGCIKQNIFYWVKRFFISNAFISNARLKLAKNQANAKQHPENELLLFEK